jgi:hypothetical protein
LPQASSARDALLSVIVTIVCVAGLAVFLGWGAHVFVMVRR